MKNLMISLSLTLLLFSIPLTAETKILAFAGSTRQDSLNKKLLNEAAETARKLGSTVTVIDLRDFPMPFYDEDFEREHGMPENVKKFRKLMIQSDAIMIASPEYNGSISAVLKNLIDWTSRSENGKPSREAFLDKKFALMSTSPGGGGGARGLGHLSVIIENIGGSVLKEQVVVPNGYSAFNAQGMLVNNSLKEELKAEVKQLIK